MPRCLLARQATKQIWNSIKFNKSRNPAELVYHVWCSPAPWCQLGFWWHGQASGKRLFNSFVRWNWLRLQQTWPRALTGGGMNVSHAVYNKWRVRVSSPTCIGVQSWPETFRSKLFVDGLLCTALGGLKQTYLLHALASGSTEIAAPFKLAQLILSVRFQLRSSLPKENGYVCRYNSAVNACGRHIEFICQIGET